MVVGKPNRYHRIIEACWDEGELQAGCIAVIGTANAVTCQYLNIIVTAIPNQGPCNRHRRAVSRQITHLIYRAAERRFNEFLYR